MTLREQLQTALEHLRKHGFGGNAVMAQAEAARAVALARREQETDLLGLLLIEQGSLALGRGEMSHAQEILQEAVRVLGRGKHERDQVRALHMLGQALYTGGEYMQALDTWLKGMELAVAGGLREDCARAWVGVGKVYHAYGHTESALHFHQQAWQLAERVADPLLSCEVAINLGASAYRLHHLDDALHYLGLADAWLRGPVHHPLWSAEVMSYYGLIYFEQEDYAKAETALNEARDMNQFHRNLWGEGHVLLHLGRTYYQLQRLDEAMVCLTQANEIAVRGSLAHLVQQIEALLAQLSLETGDYRQALYHQKQLHASVAATHREQGKAMRLSRPSEKRLAQLEQRLALERVRMSFADYQPAS